MGKWRQRVSAKASASTMVMPPHDEVEEVPGMILVGKAPSIQLIAMHLDFGVKTIKAEADWTIREIKEYLGHYMKTKDGRFRDPDNLILCNGSDPEHMMNDTPMSVAF